MKVGIENRDQLTCCEFQSVFQSAGLETMSVRAMDVMDVETSCAIFRHARRRDLGRAVGGIVENLDFEKFARISDVAGRFDQPFDNIHFVVNRQAEP